MKLVTLNDVHKSTDLAGNKTERLRCYGQKVFLIPKKVLRRIRQNIKPFNKANQSYERKAQKTQLTFTCSKSTIEALEKCGKYIQS